MSVLNFEKGTTAKAQGTMAKGLYHSVVILIPLHCNQAEAGAMRNECQHSLLSLETTGNMTNMVAEWKVYAAEPCEKFLKMHYTNV